MLNRPNYVTMNSDGGIDKLFCKVCGGEIAGTVEGTKQVGAEKIKTMKFMRFPNYTEAKFVFNDGSYHVTNGCNNCLKTSLTDAEMKEIYIADMNGMGLHPGIRRPISVVQIETGGGGIV